MTLSVSKVVFVLLTTLVCLCAAENPVESCYEIRGRLSFWNGAPSTRIWIIGTHRMLGVHDEDQNLPSNLSELLKGDFDDEVFGNFVVCPLTRYKAGEMQIVYVKSANHLVYQHRAGN